MDLTAFRQRYRADLLEEYGESLRRPLAAGLIERPGQRLRLTDRGVLLSNEVFQSVCVRSGYRILRNHEG